MSSFANKVVFIEGAQDRDISIFISRMNDYYRGEGDYSKIVSTAKYDALPPRKRQNSRKAAFSDPSRSKNEITLWNAIVHHGLPFAFRSINMRAGSPESRLFLTKLAAGELPANTNIAGELLQAHFDYINVIADLSGSHELLVGHRSLMSYYVDIIIRQGRKDLIPAFDAFVEKVGTTTDPIIILTSSPKVTQQRHLEALGESPTEDVLEKELQDYQDAVNTGIWTNVTHINVDSEDPDHYRAFFASIAYQIKA